MPHGDEFACVPLVFRDHSFCVPPRRVTSKASYIHAVLRALNQVKPMTKIEAKNDVTTKCFTYC